MEIFRVFDRSLIFERSSRSSSGPYKTPANGYILESADQYKTKSIEKKREEPNVQMSLSEADTQFVAEDVDRKKDRKEDLEEESGLSINNPIHILDSESDVSELIVDQEMVVEERRQDNESSDDDTSMTIDSITSRSDLRESSRTRGTKADSTVVRTTRIIDPAIKLQ